MGRWKRRARSWGERQVCPCGAVLGVPSIPASHGRAEGSHGSSTVLCLHGNAAGNIKTRGIYVLFSPSTSPGQHFTGAQAQHQQAAIVLWGWGDVRGAMGHPHLSGTSVKQRDPNLTPAPGLNMLAAPRARVQAGQGVAKLMFAAPLALGGIFESVVPWRSGEAGRSNIWRKAQLPWEGRTDGKTDRGRNWVFFLFFFSPHLVLTEVPQGELMHFVLKSQFVRKRLGLHTLPARPCPGQCPMCAGLAEIPSLERAMERVFAVSSGECDVMSLVGGQAGRDRPPWVRVVARG